MSCGEKRDKLTVLKEDMIGEDVKDIYGKKIMVDEKREHPTD